MNIWPQGKYRHDPEHCNVFACSNRPAWVIRPSTPAFAAPQFGACPEHLEVVLRDVAERPT